MSIQLNHTIVWCRDNLKSARFLTELFGLPAPRAFGPFQIVELGNGVSLDYHVIEGATTSQPITSQPIASQHYAFLISEAEFDTIFGRIRAQGLQHWADPGRRRTGEINHNDGGRGVYFPDPDGHLLEIITRPYGTGL